jgi:hypothetical protein
MGVNAFVDIAIGLSLMYLLLSLMCTTVNEIVSQVLSWRAKMLRKGIEKLIDDGALKLRFYNHGLVVGAKEAADSNHPSYLSGETFARALIGSLDPTTQLPEFAAVQTAIRSLPPDCTIRDVALSHVLSAQGNLDKLRTDLANWFDHVMDRATGAYKRKLRWVSLGIGLLLAAGLNADSIRVAERLWSDGTLRESLAQAGAEYVKRHPSGVGTDADRAVAESNATKSTSKATGPSATKSGGGPGTGAGGNAASSADPKDANTARDEQTGPSIKDDLRKLKEAQESLRAFPLGWDLSSATSFSLSPLSLLTMDTLRRALVKLVGVVLTGLAISLGAPFWFDLLSKFAEVRATGKKPERTTAS